MAFTLRSTYVTQLSAAPEEGEGDQHWKKFLHLETLPSLQKARLLGPVTFNKETAGGVIDGLVVSINNAASEVALRVFGNIFLGSDAGIHTPRNHALLMVLAILWESKAEIRYVAERVAESPFDDVKQRVTRVNDCLHLIARLDGSPYSGSLTERAKDMYTAHLLSDTKVK